MPLYLRSNVSQWAPGSRNVNFGVEYILPRIAACPEVSDGTHLY